MRIYGIHKFVLHSLFRRGGGGSPFIHPYGRENEGLIDTLMPEKLNFFFFNVSSNLMERAANIGWKSGTQCRFIAIFVKNCNSSWRNLLILLPIYFSGSSGRAFYSFSILFLKKFYLWVWVQLFINSHWHWHWNWLLLKLYL